MRVDSTPLDALSSSGNDALRPATPADPSAHDISGADEGLPPAGSDPGSPLFASHPWWSILHRDAVDLVQHLYQGDLPATVARLGAELVQAACSRLFLLDGAPENLSLAGAYHRSDRDGSLPGCRWPDDDLAHRVLESRKPVLLRSGEPGWGGENRAATGSPTVILGVPILGPSGVYGALCVAHDEDGRSFSGDAIQALTLFAEQASAVLQVAQARRVVEARLLAEERARLARDLHDGLIQQLLTVGMRVDLCRCLLEEDPAAGCTPDADRSQGATDRQALLRNELAAAKTAIQNSVQEARRLVFAFRESALTDQSLEEALGGLVARTESQLGIPISFSVSGQRPTALPPGFEAALLRVGQEALNNVRKHAAATQIQVQLVWTTTDVRLSVQDNGHGFDVAAGWAAQDAPDMRYGLASMYERLAGLQGELVLESQPGSGTRVCAVVRLA